MLTEPPTLATVPSRFDYPGAQPPDRSYRVDAEGISIAVNEWGRESDPVLYLVHGGADFSRTFDVFAPILAASGWRIVAWDHRGHGDSDHGQLYSFDADLRDAHHVLEAVTGQERVPVIGHSKGGAMMIALANAEPNRFSAIVNIDGMPWKNPAPDVAEHERTQFLSTEIDAWLAHRRRTAELVRRPGTPDELAARRGRMNTRFSHEWLRYLVSVGATESDDGWRWKLDPSIRMNGFGPWRPEWARYVLAGLAMPFLGILVGQREEMGWQTMPRHIEPWLPEDGRLLFLDDVGHFPHIEDPHRVATILQKFFAEARS